MSNNWGQKAKIRDKNEQTFRAFTNFRLSIRVNFWNIMLHEHFFKRSEVTHGWHRRNNHHRRIYGRPPQSPYQPMDQKRSWFDRLFRRKWKTVMHCQHLELGLVKWKNREGTHSKSNYGSSDRRSWSTILFICWEDEKSHSLEYNTTSHFQSASDGAES